MNARLTTMVCAIVCACGGTALAQRAPVRAQGVPGERPGNMHVLIGENAFLTRDFLRHHRRDSNGGTWGDNMVVADLWYDAVHRRVKARSVDLFEVNDPADLRLGRAPGHYPNMPDTSATLPPGTIVGHVGFVGWSQNGYGAYQTAIQGAVIDETRGMLFLSAAPGTPGTMRNGSRYDAGELVQHVALMPDGAVVFGYNTDPAQTPDALVTIRGNLKVEGVVYATKCVEVPPAAGAP